MNTHGGSLDATRLKIANVQRRDPDVHGARLFGLVYPTGRDDIEELIGDVYRSFLFSNSLNPLRFPALLDVEREVLSFSGELVHRTVTDQHAGSMTSGGTESILMSMLVNRERARARGIERPEILAPASAHPAYAKAAHYFDMALVPIPLDENYRADVVKARELVTDQTCVIVGSAYSYPHGAMDPIEELAAIALEAGIGCHVDACIGGFVLPYMEQLGYEVPLWDFRVPGVTEISMDLHKYGYVPKGASVILHRDDDWIWHQTFFYEGWGSGLYATPAIGGARSAAATVSAWALMDYLGVEGYRELTADLLGTTERFRAGFAAIEGLEVVGEPIGPLLAVRSSVYDLFAVADVLDDRGWYVNRNTDPHGLHLMFSPAHRGVVDEFLADLVFAVENHGSSRGVTARYS